MLQRLQRDYYRVITCTYHYINGNIGLDNKVIIDVMICTCNYSVIISLCNLGNIGLDNKVIIDVMICTCIYSVIISLCNLGVVLCFINSNINCPWCCLFNLADILFCSI
jgi:hypothetical protein